MTSLDAVPGLAPNVLDDARARLNPERFALRGHARVRLLDKPAMAPAQRQPRFCRQAKSPFLAPFE